MNEIVYLHLDRDLYDNVRAHYIERTEYDMLAILRGSYTGVDSGTGFNIRYVMHVKFARFRVKRAIELWVKQYRARLFE